MTSPSLQQLPSLALLTTSDQFVVWEIKNHLEKFKTLYNGQLGAFVKNYTKQMQEGIYNRQVAIKEITNNLLKAVISDYNKHFGRRSRLRKITQRAKIAAAKSILESIEHDIITNIKHHQINQDIIIQKRKQESVTTTAAIRGD
jgi:hypothetical protein